MQLVANTKIHWFATRVTIHTRAIAVLSYDRYVRLPFLATLRSIKIAIFGNFWTALLLMKMQNIARNGKKVT